MENKSFVFFASWLAPVEMLNEVEVGEYLLAIATYGTTGQRLNVSDKVALALALVYHDIDAARDKYVETCKKRQEAGRRGAAKTHWIEVEQMVANGGKCCQMVANGGLNDNDNDNDNIKKPSKKRKTFAKPTKEEVDAYIIEYAGKKGVAACFDAEQWLSHYESNGWLVGKNKMVDWKGAIRTWFGNRANVAQPAQPVAQPTAQEIEDRRKPLDDFEQSRKTRLPAHIVREAIAAGLSPAEYIKKIGYVQG